MGFNLVYYFNRVNIFIGDRAQYNNDGVSFMGSSFKIGGTLSFLFDKGTLHMWSGETYVGEAFKDIFNKNDSKGNRKEYSCSLEF